MTARAALRGLAAAVALGALVLALFGRATDHAFVGFDDEGYVTENAWVRAGLTRAGVAWAFTTFQEGHYHPLTWLSHMAVAEVAGLDPAWHHGVNVVLHALCAVLLWGFLRYATGSPWASLVAAGLWATHPLRVEAVAWVSARKDPLSTAFLLATLWAHAVFARRRDAGQRGARVALPLAGALIAFAAGLLTKPMLVTLPVVLLVLDFWPLARLPDGGLRAPAWRARLGRLGLEKLPYLVLALAQALLTLHGQRAAGAVQELGWPARVAGALQAYLAYAGQTLWPRELSVFYPLRPTLPGVAAAALVALLVITASLARLARTSGERAPLAGWLLFVVTALPIVGLVQVGGQAMADRYSYVPGIGLTVLVVWGVSHLLEQAGARGVLTPAGVRAASIVGAAAALVVGVATTSAQLPRWRDTEALFRHALAVDPDNFMAHTNLGAELDRQARYDEAEPHFREAVRLNPGYPTARLNLGVALARRGAHDAALEHFAIALRRQPDSALALYNAGLALAHLGRYDEAEAHYRRALAHDGGYAMAHFSLGALLSGTGRVAEGRTHLLRAAELQPGWDEPLAILRRAQGP